MVEFNKSNDPKREADELNRMAWELRIKDSIKAKEYSHEAIKLCRKINYNKGLADALRVNAFGYIRKADLTNGLLCLDEAETIYNTLKDKKGLATINEYKGIIERNNGNSGKALELIFKALEQSRETSFVENEITNLYQIGVTFKSLANYEKALEHLYESLTLSRTIGFKLMEGYNLNIIGSIYLETDDYEKALDNFRKGLLIRQESGDKWGEAGSLDNIGNIYFKLKDYVNAINFTKKSLEITTEIGDKKGKANSLFQLAKIYQENNDLKMALELSNQSLKLRTLNHDKRGEAEILMFLANPQFDKFNDNTNVQSKRLLDSLMISKEIKANDLASKACYGLYLHFKTKQKYDDAIKYLEQHIQYEKELHKDAINEKLLNLEISLKAEEARKEAEAIKLKNEELIKLNNEIRLQKKKVDDALTELKSTQSQLIQSEKMASLGELTAGIAHEIQNPLNFVNNFSEVSKELLEEMMEELKNGDIEEVEAIAKDIIENLEKVTHHGKRADAIVKGMLQHSRTSSGVKEPTNINALADEYFRLAYHGLRAKDKSFNATMKTDFDENIGKINIIPQDMGRVILNLINNAFYVVDEKKNLRQAQGNDSYKPTVTVSTKKLGDIIEICVEDNGNGIPQKLIDKIFQPFFTTKPTGSGTGLGLSLSYDIVKAHGGELKVETKEGEGTTFIIKLPI